MRPLREGSSGAGESGFSDVAQSRRGTLLPSHVLRVAPRPPQGPTLCCPGRWQPQATGAQRGRFPAASGRGGRWSRPAALTPSQAPVGKHVSGGGFVSLGSLDAWEVSADPDSPCPLGAPGLACGHSWLALGAITRMSRLFKHRPGNAQGGCGSVAVWGAQGEEGSLDEPGSHLSSCCGEGHLG